MRSAAAKISDSHAAVNPAARREEYDKVEFSLSANFLFATTRTLFTLTSEYVEKFSTTLKDSRISLDARDRDTPSTFAAKDSNVAWKRSCHAEES